MTQAKNGRASVSKERKLALVLRALLDSLADAEIGEAAQSAVTLAELDANGVLKEMGYSNLVGIPKQVAGLTAQLESAKDAGDWSTVAKVAADLERVKAGKPIKSAAPSAGKKSSTKKLAKVSTASTKTPKDDVSGATKPCAICGNLEDFADHQKESENYHVHRADIKVK